MADDISLDLQLECNPFAKCEAISQTSYKYEECGEASPDVF